MNTLEVVAVVMSWVVMLSALGWVTWLYLHEHGYATDLRRDNTRLIHRLARYHSVSLDTPDGPIIPVADHMPPIPPAFRYKRPSPPRGWQPDKTGDIFPKAVVQKDDL